MPDVRHPEPDSADGKENGEQEKFQLDFLGPRDRIISCELHYA